MTARTLDAWRALLRDRPLPAALVDLEAFDDNARCLAAALPDGGPTLRVASKSVRVPALLRRLLDGPWASRLRGLMTFSAHETAWLADEGFDDLLLAYPIGRADEAAALARAATAARVTAMVDDVAQARLLSAAAAEAGVTLSVGLDVDASWRPLGGAVHLGVRRSPVRTAEDALRLARAVRPLPGLRVDAVMAYEAQVAGLRDRTPGGGPADRLSDGVKRVIKRRSVGLVAARRAAVVDALRAEGFSVDLVNGGGTGSVHSTGRDPVVTEVTAGSGFVCPHLFDGYADLPLRPALFFALAVVRRSDPDHVTCAGGGYVASGPAAVDRLPVVHAPSGWAPLGMEGFGEVQTPLRRGRGAEPLGHGDPVLFRPAKAGELAERFASYLLVRGDEVVDEVPTLRGAGRAFF